MATHPDGEAQIVAYSQQETYAPPFGYHAFITMLIMPVLAAIGKEVALVIADKAAVRLYKVQPVVEPAVTLQGEASGYGGVLLPGSIPHPLERGLITLGYALRFRSKAC